MSEEKSKKSSSKPSSNASVKSPAKRTPGPPPGGSGLRSKGPSHAASRMHISSGSRRAAPLQIADKAPPQTSVMPRVYDENNVDVTPLPLLNDNRPKTDQPTGGTPDITSMSSIMPGGTVTASTFGGGPFSRSVLSMSQSGRSSVSYDDLDPFSDGVAAPAWTEMKMRRDDMKEVLSESDLEREITVNLTETDTIWMLDIPGICVAEGGEETSAIIAQNERYQELVKSRVGNDLYVERGMNTFNEQPKQKSVQTNRINYADEGIQASNWDMYDTYKELADVSKETAKPAEEEEGLATARPEENQLAQKKILSASSTDSRRPASSNEDKTDGDNRRTRKDSESQSTFTSSSAAGTESVYAMKAFSEINKEEIMKEKNAAILESAALKNHMAIMERALSLNKHQQRTACYRQLPVFPEIKFEEEDESKKEEEDEDNLDDAMNKQSKHTTDKFSTKSRIMDIIEVGPKLERLWSFQCPLTKGHNVSCMAWNKVNPDILAVGYGQFEFSKQKGGYCCCWSLKNIEYPERVFKFDVGVTALDFSQAHPNHMAVGLYDGTIAIYNVRNPTDEPVLTNREAAGKHSGPVWQLKWIEKERGAGEMKTEVLVSVSTDGRVTQWSIRKGFESYDLMKLKRTQVKSGTGRVKKADALISKNAGGLCFSFSPRDTNVYLVGTEEGFVHKCSCSYNEQYLDTYGGHTGPVYRVQWSPFCPDVFASSSGDYTMKLWHQDRLVPIISCQSSFKIVHDICWSPRCSTVFACVNEGGVEVWDLSQSVIDPVLQDRGTEGVNLSAVTFAPNSECILFGDSDGAITVLQIVNLSKPSNNQAEILSALVESTIASQINAK